MSRQMGVAPDDGLQRARRDPRIGRKPLPELLPQVLHACRPVAPLGGRKRPAGEQRRRRPGRFRPSVSRSLCAADADRGHGLQIGVELLAAPRRATAGRSPRRTCLPAEPASRRTRQKRVDRRSLPRARFGPRGGLRVVGPGGRRETPRPDRDRPRTSRNRSRRAARRAAASGRSRRTPTPPRSARRPRPAAGGPTSRRGETPKRCGGTSRGGPPAPSPAIAAESTPAGSAKPGESAGSRRKLTARDRRSPPAPR